MKKTAIFSVFLLIFSTSILFAKDEKAKPKGTSGCKSSACTTPKAEAKIDLAPIVEDLDAEDPKVRAAASTKLAKLHKKYLPELEKLLKDPDLSVEARSRIEKAVETIKAQGGIVCNGLRFKLMADKKQVMFEDTFNLTTVVENVSEKPLKLMVGYSVTGNYFENGKAIEVATPTGDQHTPKCMAGFCGTGARYLFEIIKPGETKKFVTPVSLEHPRHVRKAVKGPQPTNFNFGKGKLFSVGYKAMGTYTFTLKHQSTGKESTPWQKGIGIVKVDKNGKVIKKKSAAKEGKDPQKDIACWSGSFTSNKVFVEVVK